MATQTREPEVSGARAVRAPESGVIDDARRHRRRERKAVSLLVLSLAAVAWFGFDGSRDSISLASSSRPTWMSGVPLSSSTRLTLLVSENGGRPWLVNIPSGRVHPVRGLGLPRAQGPWSPMLWPLERVGDGALGVLIRDPCRRCAETETHFLITPSGRVRRFSTFALRPDQHATTPVLGSSTAIWVLTHPRAGPCTLREEPGSRGAVTVPCGDLVDSALNGSDSPAGLIISTGNRMVLINPRTGRVRARSPLGGQLDVLSKNMVLAGGPTGVQGQGEAAPKLTLTDMNSGASRRLRWPSTLRFGYQVFPDPGSSMVAVEFADPAYRMTSLQAGDVWLLNARNGNFTHVPGFPIFEYLKVSGMAWTTDHRLVIVAYGRRRPRIGVWRPGSHRLQVGAAPKLAGYLQFVPFTR